MEETTVGEWRAEAQKAFEQYLDAVEQDAPAGSSVVAIERAMLRHSPKMMSDTMQALADAQELSPPRDPRGT